jgi:hypothetical protein
MFLGPKRFPSVPKINKSFIYHVQVEAWNDTKQFKIGHIPMYIKTCNLGFIPISQFRDTIRDIVTDKSKDFKFILSLKNRETPEVQITAKIDKSMYWNRAERGLLVVGTLFFLWLSQNFFVQKV